MPTSMSAMGTIANPLRHAWRSLRFSLGMFGWRRDISAVKDSEVDKACLRLCGINVLLVGAKKVKKDMITVLDGLIL